MRLGLLPKNGQKWAQEYRGRRNEAREMEKVLIVGLCSSGFKNSRRGAGKGGRNSEEGERTERVFAGS